MTLSLAQELTLAFVLHNEAHRLRSLFQALSAVEGIGQVHEILLIDNASTDETLAHLEEFRKSSTLHVKILSRSRNHMGEARQDALYRAETRWVLFCDGDCLPSPTWLMRYDQVLKGMGSKMGSVYAGVGGPARPLADEKGKAMAEVLSHFKWTHLHSPQGALKGAAWDADHLPCSNVLMDRELVLSHGGFSEAIERVGEDLELGLRLKAKGLMWRVVPQLQLHHQRDYRLKIWAQKMLAYGRAQVFVGRLRGEFHPRAMAALTAAGLGILWILLLFLQPVPALAAALVYSAGVLLQVSFCPGVRLRHRLYALLLIPTTHLLYALGALLEFVAPPKSLG